MQLDHNKTGSTLLEEYDPSTDTWETLAPRPKVRIRFMFGSDQRKILCDGRRLGR